MCSDDKLLCMSLPAMIWLLELEDGKFSVGVLSSAFEAFTMCCWPRKLGGPSLDAGTRIGFSNDPLVCKIN